MTNFAALRRAHAADLAGAVWREIILVHVALAFFRPDGVKTLPFIEHAKRTNRERLGLTALEET